MECSVSVTVAVGVPAGVVELEQAILQAGWDAMRQALQQAVRTYEDAHSGCPHCGGTTSRSQGTVRRRVLTRFGKVVLRLRRQRCRSCQRRFRPAHGCLAALGREQVTPELATACALAGASWPYATAAGVLRHLSGVQISAEEVRRQTVRAGQRTAAAQQAEAEQVLRPTAADVRAERDRQAAQDRAARAGHPPTLAVVPARLIVGLDGGWVPSREQAGGMEGKVGVVATGGVPVGKHGRQRLTPRRYVATFGASEQVGQLAAAAAVALGGYAAPEQLVLGDGAEWIKTQAAEHFPDAVGILDWAHVARAVHKAIRAACPGPAQRARRHDLHQQIPDALWHGNLPAALAQLQALRPPRPTGSAEAAQAVGALEDALRYLAGQRRWLGDSAAWQAAGTPIGSGGIERAVAVVINWRMKKRGMRWGRPTANAVVALRVCRLNGDWAAAYPASPLAA
jgi:hypothetical protein